MKIDRRNFITRSCKAGAMVLAGSSLLPQIVRGMGTPAGPDIAVITGMDYYASTLKAVEFLGGMGRFIRSGGHVGLLINSAFDNKGAYVNPDIAIAVVKMCADAGASQITTIQFIADEYWMRSRHYKDHEALLKTVVNTAVNTFPATYSDEHFIKVPKVEGSAKLGEAEVIKVLFECDSFISIPISKHHATTLLTCIMKNMMGVCTRKTNVSMHLGSGVRNDPDYLAQCIADINLVRKADLYVVDSTEFITTNGPDGPGELRKPDKVLAGTDPVAMDALCSTYLGYDPEDILTTTKASQLGLGEPDFTRLNIHEANL
jgi:uncharacterized protein (DUF362 family)